MLAMNVCYQNCEVTILTLKRKKDENLFVWINEEDHMRIVSMEKGDNVKRIIERFAMATQQIQVCLKEQGFDFMHSDHLGWILTCPSNLGTGLRAGCMVKLPLFSARPDFKSILGKMGLQARGCGGVDSDSVGGIWDISNADRNVQKYLTRSLGISYAA